ncbi:ParA family protein [Clostridium perfringens]|uniref:ParA family protein n=1 Tax=Clostridium perfringens TaxID=1502 RepID=UPI001F058E71|nr:ParA family protein [Clostridium perfringens]
MGKVISFINMKGGVGKTTLCLGIGEYLAHNYQKKVLYIDLDPQFNTTQSLMNEFNLTEKYLSEYYYNRNVRDIFKDPSTITEKPKVPNSDELIVKLDDYMSIIPGTINLIFEDTSRTAGKVIKVKKFIKDNKLKDDYDFIFIDCPPTISLYTDSALIASDYYLVPNRIDRYSILGIKLLKQVIDRLECDNDLDIKPLGVVYTIVRDDGLKTRKLKEAFEQNEIVQEIGLFEAGTSYVNDLLVGLQGNIASKYKKSSADIKLICDEFIERIENDE